MSIPLFAVLLQRLSTWKIKCNFICWFDTYLCADLVHIYVLI